MVPRLCSTASHLVALSLEREHNKNVEECYDHTHHVCYTTMFCLISMDNHLESHVGKALNV